jgi:hypothetical protein
VSANGDLTRLEIKIQAGVLVTSGHKADPHSSIFDQEPFAEKVCIVFVLSVSSYLSAS